MGLTNWVAVTTVAAGLANVGTLLVVAWQLRTLSRQTREQAREAQATAEALRASVYLSTMQSMLSIDQFLADRPRLRADLYGYRPGGWRRRRRQRRDAGAEMLFDLFKMVLTVADHHEFDEREGWRRYITSVMRGSPALRDFWRRNGYWYSETMQGILNGWKDGPDAGPPSVGDERSLLRQNNRTEPAENAPMTGARSRSVTSAGLSPRASRSRRRTSRRR